MAKNSTDFKAVILAGGSGERFWPLSTAEKPKQFLRVFGGESLIRQSVTRLKGLVRFEDVYVVTSKDLVAATRRELPEIPAANIVGEPLRRDTGAAVALGVGIAGEGTIGVFSSDQLVMKPAKFRAAVRKAAALARKGARIVTLGIKPTFPSTAFGYVDRYSVLDSLCTHGVERLISEPPRPPELRVRDLRLDAVFESSYSAVGRGKRDPYLSVSVGCNARRDECPSALLPRYDPDVGYCRRAVFDERHLAPYSRIGEEGTPVPAEHAMSLSHVSEALECLYRVAELELVALFERIRHHGRKVHAQKVFTVSDGIRYVELVGDMHIVRLSDERAVEIDPREGVQTLEAESASRSALFIVEYTLEGVFVVRYS